MGKEIPISAVLGDQQAAAVGQACFEKGSITVSYTHLTLPTNREV